jgi:predicted metal-binding protein
MNKFPTTLQNRTLKSDFAQYFSNLDSQGLASLLKDDTLYDELSKLECIELLEKQFKSFKEQNIHFLKAVPGSCIGCKKGCSGFTFLDEDSGF